MQNRATENVDLVPNYGRAIYETLLRIESLIASTHRQSPSLARGSRATMSIKEAAEYIGVSKNQMYELVHAGAIKSIRVGQRFVIPRHALDEFLQST